MDFIIIVLSLITLFTLIYLIWLNYKQISMHIQFLEIKFSWFGYFIFIIELIIITLIYYYIIPYFYKNNDLVVAYLTIYTVTNFSALFLSWIYFNNTHCWRDEGNKITRKLYFLIGEDIGHFIMLIIRLVLNFFVAKFLLTGELRLESDYFDGFKTIIFFYSIICSIYTVELISNIVSNFYGETFVCKNVNYLCKNYKIACDVPAKIKEKLIKKNK